jgi:hypothetical protein
MDILGGRLLFILSLVGASIETGLVSVSIKYFSIELVKFYGPVKNAVL